MPLHVSLSLRLVSSHIHENGPAKVEAVFVLDLQKSFIVVSGQFRELKSIHTAGWKIRATSHLTTRPLPTARSLELEPRLTGESDSSLEGEAQEEREKDAVRS